MASIQINGKRIIVGGSVSSVMVSGRGVFIDGQRIEDGEFVMGDERVFNILVEGDVDTVTNETGNINVKGQVGSVKNVSGDVLVSGDAQGSVSTVSGDVKVKGSVLGSVKTVSGDISHR